MKQTLFYQHVQNALCAQMTLRVEGIDAEGPGDKDEDGYYTVAWQTAHPLSSTARAWFMGRYEPDTIEFNQPYSDLPEDLTREELRMLADAVDKSVDDIMQS